jgi:predicted phage-related endonuclease
MIILDVVQGSPEWVAARAKYFCASDAPVMMGASKRTTRTELLRMKSSGDERAFTEWQQANLLDKGHEAEAAARALVEASLGEELYPTTGAHEAGYLLASFDGVTMDGETGFEHKLWNEDLAAQVRAGELPPSHYWQLEQQILVGGLKRVIFVCSNGTPEKFVQMEYRPVPGRAQQLLAGWKQFDEDLKNYRHVEVLPRATPQPVMALPALSIRVNGTISLVDNLDLFGKKLQAFIEGIDKNPSDDQAFANAEAAVKTLQSAQEALDAAESAALAQTASIDEMRRTVGMYRDLARSNRLMLEKLVTARKETIREDIRRDGVNAFSAHLDKLNQRLGKPYMPNIAADFGGVMKGKKTIASLRDAVATELARSKIDANAVADRIDINLKFMREHAADHAFLFADTAQIALKANDDFEVLVRLRISEHKQQEEKRLADERERIRKEEADKLARAAAEAPVAPVLAATPQPVPAVVTPTPEAQRGTDDAVKLLTTFIERYGKQKEYATVTAAIRTYLAGNVRKSKARAA